MLEANTDGRVFAAVTFHMDHSIWENNGWLSKERKEKVTDADTEDGDTTLPIQHKKYVAVFHFEQFAQEIKVNGLLIY